MEQCLELGEGQHQRIDGGADIADISHVADWCQSNAHRNVHMIQKAPSAPAWSCPRCSTCNWESAKSYHRDATDKADLWWGGSTWDFDHVRVIFHESMPGDRRCLPKCLLPEHGNGVGKCHYRSQPKNFYIDFCGTGGSRPGICVYGHLVINRASTSFLQSMKDEQTVDEMGLYGTCHTYGGLVPF